MAGYRRRTDKSAVALLVLVTVIAVAALGGVSWFAFGPSPYDGIDTKTFCRKGDGGSLTVVLLDTSDPLTPQQNERLLNALNHVRESVPRFDRIVLFALDDHSPSGVTGPLVDACNPGNAQETDKFRENARILSKKYAQIFDAPFKAALDAILSGGATDHSPIIEAIEEATVKTFGALRHPGDVRKRLIVVSDMIQNTTAVSFYRAIPEFPGFENSDEFKLHRPVLNEVEINIWEINRPAAGNTHPRAKVAEFWSKYFQAQGATLSGTFWDATKV